MASDGLDEGEEESGCAVEDTTEAVPSSVPAVFSSVIDRPAPPLQCTRGGQGGRPGQHGNRGRSSERRTEDGEEVESDRGGW